ncbi:hypothetical protein [Bacillus testis]|uniref:hypothetical protein n=1 Tax=Bacillus testis TaxID=1622072 RepID=UPI0011C7E416|nr:hypothetical protein [Bacillus testis]
MKEFQDWRMGNSGLIWISAASWGCGGEVLKNAIAVRIKRKYKGNEKNRINMLPSVKLPVFYLFAKSV